MTFLHLLTIETHKTLKHPALRIRLSALLFLLAMFIWIDHAQIARDYPEATGVIATNASAISEDTCFTLENIGCERSRSC